MAEWGRKEYSKAWPSRRPVWTRGALFAAVLLFVGGLPCQYFWQWNFVERFYLPMYAKTWVRGSLLPTNGAQYRLLDIVNKKGQQRMGMDGEVEPIQNADGRTAYALTDAAAAQGWVKPVWNEGEFNDKRLHAYLEHWIYQDQTVWDFVKYPAYGSLAFFVLALFFAVPKDRKRRMIWKHGRRLRGPELVTTRELNEKLGRSTWLTTTLPDGVAFINEEQTRWDKVFYKEASGWARIPREREAMHFLIVGDSGTGKSAAIRQILSQINDRGETAIVYDPAMEYLTQFYSESRGDVVLNPMDARCPFWKPGDEVMHEAEALTLAASLFPDQGRENRFFVEAPRKIFAHLINLKPTPEELTYWLCHAEEIDKRVAGTELEALIDRGATAQRSGVLGSLNMVADAFKLLPKEPETTRRWSTAEWAKERKGWIFLIMRRMSSSHVSKNT